MSSITTTYAKKGFYSYMDGVRDGLPIGLGYLSVAFTFGITAVSSGLKAFEAIFISMTNLTSAGQVAGLSVIVASGAIIEMILTQLVINMRYALMGISLTQRLDSSFTTPKRILTSAFITDEIFAVAMSKKHPIGTVYFLGLATLPYLGWSLGTALGAIAGNILPERLSLSLGIAIYAMFIAIIVPPVKTDRSIAVAIAVASALSSLLYYTPGLSSIPDGFAIIIVAITSSLFMAIFFPIKSTLPIDEGGEINEE